MHMGGKFEKTEVVYKKAYDTRRAGRTPVRHQTQHHNITNHRVYKYTITNN